MAGQLASHVNVQQRYWKKHVTSGLNTIPDRDSTASDKIRSIRQLTLKKPPVVQEVRLKLQNHNRPSQEQYEQYRNEIPRYPPPETRRLILCRQRLGVQAN